METGKIYRIATWALLALNLVLVAALILGRPGARPDGIRPPHSLALTGEQTDRFRELATVHRDQAARLTDEQRQLLRTYFQQLTEVDSLLPVPPAVLDLERRRIESTFLHFQDIRALLTAEQRAGFPEFVDSALNRILMTRGQKNRR